MFWVVMFSQTTTFQNVLICKSIKNELRKVGQALLQSGAALMYYKVELVLSEAAARRCSVKKLFSKISQNLQKNTCTRVSYYKKWFWQKCFPVNLANILILRTLFFLEHLSWLPLCYYKVG